ncbi:MAG: TIGR00341 family protein [Hyphomonas sp.]|uniref:TIGR00341 family protein n=1 Tax=Hyphomonas sp. TaxID=87 RepID=UPI001D24220D|nr:TIGR00341 family protein [Hyphomonas sp.]MBA4225344.1 TIGR00341 family protein [Hyphomonas sp.]
MTNTAEHKPPRRPEWYRRLRVARWRGIRSIDHMEVVDHVHEEGGVSGRYLFMTAMSCGIAILGLLLSSPAVIIGAMLISPLMGPIMLMGFSLSILELKALREAILSLAIGTGLALGTSFLIVFLSPLTDVTPEILARTRPNFFDLLVAVFSGLAGGYAVIHRKGETIVGVAIATALMPPLAVVGYGLATAQFQLAGGAFFLYMTNLLAIALSVTVLSRFYGFGERHSPQHNFWQTGLIVGVFVALSIPLGLALRDIAYETRVRDVARDLVLVPFEGREARLSDMDVAFPRRGEHQIVLQATVLTNDRVPGAEAALAERLAERFRRTVKVSIDQIQVDDNNNTATARFLQAAESSLGAPLRAQMSQFEALAQERRTERDLRAAFPFNLAAADIDPQARSAVFAAAPTEGVTLPVWRSLEEGLTRNYADWTISVVPPPLALLPIPFAPNDDALAPRAADMLADQVWALQRWGARRVEVVAYLPNAVAAQTFDERALGHRRAARIAAVLTEAGLSASIAGEFRRGEFAGREDRIFIRPAPLPAEDETAPSE